MEVTKVPYMSFDKRLFMEVTTLNNFKAQTTTKLSSLLLLLPSLLITLHHSCYQCYTTFCYPIDVSTQQYCCQHHHWDTIITSATTTTLAATTNTLNINDFFVRVKLMKEDFFRSFSKLQPYTNVGQCPKFLELVTYMSFSQLIRKDQLLSNK